MKAVVAMSGQGTRFRERSGPVPKPLYPVHGRPMVFWAVDSLSEMDASSIIFVVRAEHEEIYQVSRLVRERYGPRTEIVLEHQAPRGQLCSVLLARQLIEVEEDLLIASADTYVESDLAHHIAQRSPACRGLISVARMSGNQWSFARTGASGGVVAVAEKHRISNWASTGLYYFASGREFVEAALRTVEKREGVGAEQYVIPVYEEYMARQWRVELSRARAMWDMGTSEALDRFLKHLSGSEQQTGLDIETI